ncbi:MAG: M1 family metallopeptidase [Flavobacteriales bacterium]|nr:M1 family metallopeptidase [Flavobacteriales bacterium]MBK9699473.1 M1 family metallopeptidase [Flavobacteriales bacterium]
MQPRTLPLALVLLLAGPASAQRFDALHPPNTYRNADNPHYWRNRPPHEAYWQQDVHYTLRARLDEVGDRIEGEGSLVYWNNSPDTLRHVFFHLYQNAYNAGSHADLMENGRATPGDTAEHGTTLAHLRVGADDLRIEMDNTVLKAWLPEPLPPGGRVTFSMAFTTHYGMDVQRRMKLFNAWGFKHYDGVHWYPRIAVYDAHMGWDTQQHLGNELYGDFGTFDVTLDMPNDMVVEATGWLQNRDEVLPRDLRDRLDLARFADKPWNEAPSVVTPYAPGRRKRWRYHAENVHDFAFTADPTYRIGEAWWNGVQCIALAQEPHAAGWQNAAAYTARIIETFSRDIGPYVYPKMVVADARDGMEYPMLTLDGGRDPEYRGLLVHEVGHNWFYGMVGNNETYRALLDEGFTQFLTSWGLEHIDGDTLVEEAPKGRYVSRFTRPELVRESEVYRGYMRDAVRNELPPIDTHSDGFAPVEGRGGGYGHVYFKTATMLYNLQYLLGDSVFLAALQHYVRQWTLCHPTVADMRQSFVRSTGVDLNPFFDAWLTTDKLVDYRVCGITRRMRSEGQTIRLRRRGGISMPIDLQVTARDGTVHDFHIPTSWSVKPTTATVLPRWTSWDKLRRTYVARVDVPTGIAAVRIDTSLRLADAYQPDNSLPRAVSIAFDHHVRNPPDRHHYEAFGRPDLWWNGFDGLKVGAHLHGSYFRQTHQLWLSAWVNTGLGQSLPGGGVDTRHDALSYVLRYSTGTTRLLKGSSIRLQARHLDGLELYGGGVSWTTPDERTTVSGDLRYMIRRDTSDLTYLLYPDEWTLNALSGLLDLAVDRSYRAGPLRGRAELRLRQPMVGSVDQGAHVRLSTRNTLRIGDLDLHLRGMAQYGSGSNNLETGLYLSGAAPEELVENKFTRSIGPVPNDWAGSYGSEVNHFHHGGGLNLRGYAGYLAPETTADGTQVLTYRGNTGLAVNAELDLDGLVRFRPKGLRRYLHLDVYIFGDVGSMGYRRIDGDAQRLELATPRADAGLGAALTIKRWGPLVDLEPLTLRFDMPLVLSSIPVGESEHVAFRYVVGIGRTF